MRLAAPDDVLAVVGIQSNAGSQATAGAALDATFPQIAAMLESSPLVRQERIDTFDLASNEVLSPRLRLACGFVSLDDTITVIANGTELTADDYDVMADPGTVHLYGGFLAGKSVITVQYSCGFNADTSDTDTLVEVPDAIKQAAISKACAYLLLNPAMSSKDKAKILAGFSIEGFELRVRQMLSPYTRPRAGYVWESLTRVLD